MAAASAPYRRVGERPSCPCPSFPKKVRPPSVGEKAPCPAWEDASQGVLWFGAACPGLHGLADSGQRLPRTCGLPSSCRGARLRDMMREVVKRELWLASLVVIQGAAWTLGGPAGGQEVGGTATERGWRLLTGKAEYLPPDFDQQVFEALWEVWEEPLRERAARATAAERRQMAFERYGLCESPDRPGGVPLQYTNDGRGGWVINCLACHGGEVAGQVVPGLPNARLALQTLVEDVMAVKLRQGKPLAHLERGALLVPLGSTVGTTNAVMFGVLLMNYRDADLNVHVNRLPPAMLHHDHDAPPLWHYRKKRRLYIDGFAPRHHRALMQFLLIPRNGPEQFRRWEADFRDIEAWILSLKPPRWPWEVDASLAERGRDLFARHCAECHGSYEEPESYPERMVPIEEIGTDRTRYDALSPEARRVYLQSWFNEYGALGGEAEPAGYVAPPLDGIWASAPYFHNGSVPTLYHVLNPQQRPVVWEQQGRAYDRQRVGLSVAEYEELPEGVASPAQRRRYFDTRRAGKSRAGHPFADGLSDEERRALLEYLKTL